MGGRKDVHKPGIKLLEKQRQRAWAGYHLKKKKKKSKSSEITLTAVVKSGMIRLESVHETLHNILLEFVF